MQSTTPQQRALEMVWTAAFDQLCHGSSEIVLTAQDGRVLGQQGIKIIAERFRYFITSLTTTFVLLTTFYPACSSADALQFCMTHPLTQFAFCRHLSSP